MKKTIIAIMALGLACLSVNDVLARRMLRIQGSDTMVNLAQRLAEVYMQKNPGKYVAVTGGGSGTGLAALVNKKTDIANVSRLARASEIERGVNQGVDFKRVIIAIDGLSVITHASNRLDLTVDQIGRIFKGEITNWSQVGGPNRPITLYGRQSNSGTFVFFRENVLRGEYSADMRRMNGNSQIVESVRQDPSAIGYVGVGYAKDADGIHIVKVAAREGAPHGNPLDAEQVRTGRYPISRPLNMYLNGNPSGDIRDFFVFVLSPEGQKTVTDLGFFPISKEYAEFNKGLGL